MGCNEINLLVGKLEALYASLPPGQDRLTVREATEALETAHARAEALEGDLRRMEGRVNDWEKHNKGTQNICSTALELASGYANTLKAERNRALDALIDLRVAVTADTFDFYTKDFQFIIGAREMERTTKIVIKRPEGEQDAD